jgi:S-adenosylmethionine decarboxylase
MTAHADRRSVIGAPPRVGAFLALVAVWTVGLFGFVRLPWVDHHLIGASIAIQDEIARWYAGPPRSSLVVTSSCSGADVAALCIGVLLAYPMPWRRRLIGALGGVALVLSVNALRLATLYRATSTATLTWLHVWVWPVILAAVALAYVTWWMRRYGTGDASPLSAPSRFMSANVSALVVYGAVVPWAFTSAALERASIWTAGASAALLTAIGAAASTVGPTLSTSRGAFLVTPECLFTPVLPIYLATVATWPMGRRRRIGWIAAAPVVFLGLGVARLLVLALPPYVTSRPTFLAHGFYEIALAAALIAGVAHIALRHRSGISASTRTAGALAVAMASAVAAAPVWQTGLLFVARAIRHIEPATLSALAGPTELQGALALLPPVQLGLLVGLWVAITGGRRFGRLGAAAGLLASSQIAVLVGVGLVEAGAGIQVHALFFRAWTIGVPVAIAAAIIWSEPLTVVGDPTYRRFWRQVGETFPSLTGAPSTSLYFENEKALLVSALGRLRGLSILKTDLWDEAKNTRILQWIADQGATAYGIDISEPIVRDARAAFAGRRLKPAVSDVRRLPFADRSFDAIYSMGTIEHFAETEATVGELVRVLKPGGRLILGVPNRYDPFLRPAVVWCLSRIGLYAYGQEKSYSRRALRRMMEAAGLDVAIETGILFIPGWIRMFDLWCHTQARTIAPLAGALVRPFVWLDHRAPTLRRHGYLLASVGVKPQAGVEYVVDAHGCDPARLQSLPALQNLFHEVIVGLALRAVADPVWHVFPDAGGITGVVLLAESHFTVHTYPEVGLATLNLYCCRPTAAWDWGGTLRTRLGARDVSVRRIGRGLSFERPS